MTVDSRAAVLTDDRTAPLAAIAARVRALPRVEILILVALFIFAMVPRTAWVVYNDRPPQGLNDPSLYAMFGDFIADGDGYIRPTGEKIAYYPVGFPATVGGLKKAGDLFGWGRSVLSIKLMNAVLGAMTVSLIYLLGRRLFDRRVGLAAGALLAIFPSQIFYTGTVLSEPLFTFLWVAALTVLFWRPWSRDGISYARLLAVGLLLSYATMTRGITLMFPLVLLGVWLVYQHSKQRAVLQALVVWAGIAVLIVPWSVRNTLAFDQLTGPSTNMGDDLCIGNFYGSNGAFTLDGKCFEGYEGMSPQEVELARNRDGVRIAIEDVVSHPLRVPRLVAQKAYWLLYKDDDGIWAAESYGHDPFIPQSRRELLSRIANNIYYVTGALTIAGVLIFLLARDVRRTGLLLAFLYVLAIPLVFFGDPRFHFPAMPLAAIIATATVIMAWDFSRRRLRGQSSSADASAG